MKHNTDYLQKIALMLASDIEDFLSKVDKNDKVSRLTDITLLDHAAKSLKGLSSLDIE